MTSIGSKQEQINSVIELFSGGKLQEALKSLSVLINKYPSESLLFNIRGACYAGLGQFNAAVKDYEKAIAIKPDYSKAHFNLGGTLQELGQLDAAVESYKKTLVIESDYAEAHNNLGIALKALGQLDAAVKSFKKAIAIQPDYVQAHYSLGTTLQELGQLDDAVKSYEEVVNIKPDFAEMHNNLGVIFNELNQNDAALKSLERAVSIKPNFAEAHNNLGNVLKELKQHDAALKSFDKAIAINPDYAEAHNHLGNVLKALGKFDAAIKSFKKVLAIKPDFIDAYNNLGTTYMDLHQLDKAIKCYEKALAINPDYAEAHNNFGITLRGLNQLDEAVKSYERALAIKPDFAEAHNNLGNALKALGQFDAAIKSYEAAIKSYKKVLDIKPDFADAYNNLGTTYMDLGQEDKAIKYYEKALDINPNFAEAHNNLGLILMNLGQLDDAIRCYDKALAIKPDFAEVCFNCGILMGRLKRMDEALANYDRAFALKPELNFLLGCLLHTKMHLCIWDDLPNDLNELTKKIIDNEKVIEPFSLPSLIDDPEIQRKTAEIYVNDKYPKNHDLPKIDQYSKHKKIRIGYFSADFREHPVGILTAELYEVHDRNKFEIYAFSYGPDTKDEINLRIKAGVDHFHDVRTMSHKEIALLARSFEIDIAVDLGGFTESSRTGIFAMSVAPVQINYLGFPGTMGADFIDYIIADPILIPSDFQRHYNEKIIQLPNSYMATDNTRQIHTLPITRTEMGLPEHGFVFCCFNNNYKISPTEFDVWMRLLLKVEGSVLWLKKSNKWSEGNFCKEAKSRGVDPSRLIFADYTSMDEHLARHRLADLFIDTFTFNAHTTTTEALWTGLPVVTKLGKGFAARVAGSLLTAIDLAELVTETVEDYEALILDLSTNPERLTTIRQKLADNRLSKPLFNTELFTKHLESAYKAVYDRYHQGLEPDHIYVENYM